MERADQPEAAPPRRPREIAFDLLKGIGIAEVLAHHSLSNSARRFAEDGSAEWWALMLFNRVLHFAIPTFLLASALLLARSIGKAARFDLARYSKRRFWRTVWPYIVWSVAYLLIRAIVMKGGGDIAPYTLHLLGFTAHGPTVLLSPDKLLYYFMWGKAFFHLYFLVVLIQVSVLVPGLVWLLKRYKVGFGTIVGVSAATQVAVHLIQLHWWQPELPGTLATSYLPSICIGIWLGLNWKSWPGIWKRWRWAIIGSAAVSLPPYLGLSCYAIRDIPISTVVYNGLFSAYATSMALLLLGVASQVSPERRLARGLAAVGTLSLPLFVIHPVVLQLEGGRRMTALVTWTYGAPIWALLVLGIGTWVVTKLLIACRLDFILFGRDFRKEADVAGQYRATGSSTDS